MLNRIISLFLSLIIGIGAMFQSFGSLNKSLRIIVPENWEMDVGDSRTLDCIINEKKQGNPVTWTAEPETVATVDKFGRVTALSIGQATITATTGNVTDSVTLSVLSTPTLMKSKAKTKNFNGTAVSEVDNLQKVVTRYPIGSESVSKEIVDTLSSPGHNVAITADGAEWAVTDYGVLRVDKTAPTERDREQRFMGERYFYSADTTNGKVLAIASDGENGIWTLMANGYTHIAMTEMSGSEKAVEMSNETQKYISRRGMVSEATRTSTGWLPSESDNDGLWTSMYGAGELMRYATLRDDKNASAEEIEQARQVATKSAEAVLMLHFISMRSGTVDAYVRRQLNGVLPGDKDDRWLSAEALLEGGNNAVKSISKSPAKKFSDAYTKYRFTGKSDALTNDGYFTTFSPESWASTNDESSSTKQFAKQTRLLKGFVARTYSLDDENRYTFDSIYWNINSDNTATGVSALTPDNPNYLINNENMRGVTVDASQEIPERLWNSLIGSEYTADDITYKGDTSADELVGHMFIFKLAYEILGPEDAELKELLVTAIDNLAQHLVDNEYMLVDGTGQPTTWSNFSRDCFLTSSAVGMAPLHALVILSIFKVAAQITGYQKWENEYRLLATDPAYEYAVIASQYSDRIQAAVSYSVNKETSPVLSTVVNLLKGTKIMETINRVILNYSDEEMAMLAFYVLFQLEDDKVLRSEYSVALDEWWVSIKYSENPLWYYIYQLAHPDNVLINDAYGNNILKTASWSLSRHPLSTIHYLASNKNRDDIGALDLSSLGVRSSNTLSYSLKDSKQLPVLSENPSTLEIVKYAFSVMSLEWTVAAPDERSYHKYNGCSYTLDNHNEPWQMDASTTYTLPYWLGRYHGMLK